jgi:hypothetical protein
MLTVEAVNGQTCNRIDSMIGFDHIILFLGEKSVLGREQAGQAVTVFLLQENPAMHKFARGGSLIG